MNASIGIGLEAVVRQPAFLLQSASPLGPLIPIALMMGIFYLLVIMPQRKRQKRLEEMLANLSTGDRVVTNGGIIGTVVGLGDATVTLRVKPDSVKLEFSRSAVAGMAEEPKN